MVASFLISIAVVTAVALPISFLEKKKIVQGRILETALLQSEKPSGYWDPAQRDCAGFVRFVLRTSSGLSSDMWTNDKKEKVNYLGTEELVRNNFSLVTRLPNYEEIETGDVLVYHAENKKPEERWHLMMLVKSPRSSLQNILAVYHNGSSGADGKVRRVKLTDLMTLTGGEWRPDPSNLRFKGVYRWKGWEQL